MIRIDKMKTVGLAGMLAMLVLAMPARAARIRDVAQLRGELSQEVTGVGLIVGLNGTGDGGDCLPSIKPLKELLTRHDDPVALEKELKDVKNVALVWVTVSLPAKGINENDKLDVKVASALTAKSLKGGRLIWCPLMNPMEQAPKGEGSQPQGKAKTIYAIASGNLIIDDESSPRQAVIKDGAVIMQGWFPKVVDNGYVFLNLKPAVASNELSTAVADLINQEVKTQTEGKDIATAMDATTVAVKIPAAEAKNPTAFIAWMNTLPLPNLPGPAKVLINTKTKTIIFTDEVELAPTMIMHPSSGLTVTVGGGGQSGPGLNAFNTLDVHKQGSARLRDLETAFNNIRLGPDDRIAIVRMLYNSGALKCELQVE